MAHQPHRCLYKANGTHTARPAAEVGTNIAVKPGEFTAALSEYVEIVEDQDATAEFKTIFGTNEYYDLTDPQSAEKSKVFNRFLFEAWNTDPQLGVSALIIQTIKDHPELEKGFSQELIEKSRRDLQ